MPQGTRKKPFSGKAKKQQLQAKKQRQNVTLLSTYNIAVEIDFIRWVTFI